MNEPATETRSVIVEREIPYPPEKIWRALTQPHLIEEWLMKNDFKPVVAIVSIFAPTGAVYWTVRSCQSSRTKRCLTRGICAADAAFNLESVVTFTLTPTSTGTHLRMEQTGFRPDQKQAYDGAKYGWQQFFAKLEQVAARID